ncbi:MAG TPA: sigma-70 family RNA polymerase sigma factor [Clostridiales bacterium]|nr:sigma-70 family RNA polymerase sigma factor [Clostridiales bacterium]
MEIKNPSSKNLDLDDLIANYRKYPSSKLLTDIVEAGSGLIHYFIRLYGGHKNLFDWYQVGVEGLLKAVNRFDPDVGAKFSTYASHCIMGELRHYIRKEASYYNPGCIKGLQYRVEQAVDNYLKKTGQVPSISEIAEKLNLREESVVEVMKGGLISFDELDLSKISNRELESFRLPIEDKLVLAQAINKLNELQKKVLYLLFFRDMTQEQAAARLGINQRKVSRIKAKSLKEMKKELDQ